MTQLVVPDSYREAHRYDGAAVEHGRRVVTERCAIQPRDLSILRDVHRYKFLTTPQLRELYWPGASVQAADRRLLKLFRAGYVERFRPYAQRGAGSYPWTYHVGEAGHRLLREAAVVPAGQRFRRRTVFDYGYVLHEVQLNAWVLAYRRALGTAFLDWQGETTFDPPWGASASEFLRGDDWSLEGAPPGRPRSVRPDAIVEIVGDNPADETRLILVEYDRTRRLDKNFDKFVRYDLFLTSWWRGSTLRGRTSPPFVLFICQDAEQRDLFVEAADRDLGCHLWHPDVLRDEHEYVGRQRVLFATERDAHDGCIVALRTPRFPVTHRSRRHGPRQVLVGPPSCTNTPA